MLALLATSRLLLGDRDGAARAQRRLIEGGRATPGVYNDAAWLGLFRGGAQPEALRWARRAVDGAPNDHAALNTLAAVYAELDRPAEARDLFLRSIEDGRPLEGADWYVHGRIAEAWSLPAPRDRPTRACVRTSSTVWRTPRARTSLRSGGSRVSARTTRP